MAAGRMLVAYVLNEMLYVIVKFFRSIFFILVQTSYQLDLKGITWLLPLQAKAMGSIICSDSHPSPKACSYQACVNSTSILPALGIANMP